MGLEPTTSAVTGRHSNQLNHRANVSVSDSYIYYHTFCVLARGFFEKILEKLSEEAEKQMINGQKICLKNLKFKVKTIEVEVIYHVDDVIKLKVKNKKVLE